jgi:excisionase family DNA binding protein
MGKEKFLTIAETAALLRVTRATVSWYGRTGRLPTVRIKGARRVLFPADAVERALRPSLGLGGQQSGTDFHIGFAMWKSGFSFQGLARALEISEEQLSAIVHGAVEPDETLKEKLARLVGCPVSDLFPRRGAA